MKKLTLKKTWGNLPIQSKLLVSMLGVLFCSILILGLYFYNVSSNLIMGHQKNYIKNTMNQVAKNLEYRIKDIEDILFELSLNPTIQDHLLKIKRNTVINHQETQVAISLNNSMITEMSKTNAIKGVFLFTPSGRVYSAGQNDYDVPDMSNEVILQGKGKNIWMLPNKRLRVIPIGKAICHLSNQQILGYFIIYVDMDYFSKVFDNISFTQHDDIFITDTQGNIVSGQHDLFPNLFQHIATYPNKIVQNVSTHQGEKQLYIVPLEKVPWQVISVSQNAMDNEELKQLNVVTVLVLGGVFVLITALVIGISKGISYPIKKLVGYIEQFSKGDFSIQASVKYDDEIGKLHAAFNKMVCSMDTLVHHVREEQSLKQQAQIQALQMQINPHFLYNTLDTINWLAFSQGAKDIGVVARSLGALMHFSLGKEEIISLEEELNAIDNYTRIQKYRYFDSLQIEMDIEEEALYEKVPRHVLLPLIENAIEHGFLDKMTDKKIWVSARIVEEEIDIEIIDNGVGIKKERLTQIINTLEETNSLEVQPKNKHLSIGLRNVHKRIRLRYGMQYGIHIHSQYGQGTCIQLKIPRGDQ
ncbi:cache domain-containing sensor histidine kinase [Vallitalea pronyensis]